MSPPAVTVRELSKRYQLGSINRHTLVAEAEHAWHRLRGKAPSAAREGRREFWALRDINFDVFPGEVIGVVGGNGSGKSTLLKILSRITVPTRGWAEIHGRVGSLLEVGTGFHPELTGRENVFMNGAMLGMKSREVAAKFDEIAAFAEVGDFIDTPVKRYSSGMYVRLAFAVAAHLEPEILIVDEVLAVGDAGFQKKCLGKIDSVARAGRTILFVSHNMAAVSQLCGRCVYLRDGEMAACDQTDRIVERYLADKNQGTDGMYVAPADDTPAQATGPRILSAVLRNLAGAATSHLDFKLPFRIDLGVRLPDRIPEGLVLSVSMKDPYDQRLCTHEFDCAAIPGDGPGPRFVRLELPGGFLLPGAYQFQLSLHVPHRRLYDHISNTCGFHLVDTGDEIGKPRSELGLFRMPGVWTLPGADVGGPLERGGGSCE